MKIPRALVKVPLGETKESRRQAVESREGRLVYACSDHHGETVYHLGFLLTDFKGTDNQCFYLMRNNGMLIKKMGAKTEVQKVDFRADLLTRAHVEGRRIHYDDLIDMLVVPSA